MKKTTPGWGIAVFLACAIVGQGIIAAFSSLEAEAIGLAAPVPYPGMARAARAKKPAKVAKFRAGHASIARKKPAVKARAKKKAVRRVKAAPKAPVPLPQNLVSSLGKKVIAPGVVYRFYRGALNINVVDADLTKGSVAAKPVLASNSFNRLADVKNHAAQTRAIAAVNANYFKKDGTPLGTLIIDKEWIAGPLYDRVSMGITHCGFVRMDRVNLYGVLTTSNPEAPSIWVNNINQPRRTGSRLILYTPRWGSHVRMPYAGTLVAVDNQGRVLDKTTTVMGIPWGGYVLSDSKHGAIAHLNRGDTVELSWQTNPKAWSDVAQAVSGGPILIKDGKLHVDLKAEKFKHGWASRSITARTAAGVTVDNHLLMVTIEGPHTLWDMAKFLRKLGAVDAMNLDGGGSTTMVVSGKTVTRNANSYQRRVASALAIVAADNLAVSKPGPANLEVAKLLFSQDKPASPFPEEAQTILQPAAKSEQMAPVAEESGGAPQSASEMSITAAPQSAIRPARDQSRASRRHKWFHIFR